MDKEWWQSYQGLTSKIKERLPRKDCCVNFKKLIFYMQKNINNQNEGNKMEKNICNICNIFNTLRIIKKICKRRNVKN